MQPAAGTLSAANPAFGTGHSIALSALTPNTTYYMRITSIDRFGNATSTDAPSLVVPGPTLHDTVAADFAAGTNINTYVAQTENGEVMLAPAAASEFSGPGLSPGWVEVPWSPDGYSIIDHGVLLVDDVRVAWCATDARGACLPGETTQTTPSAIMTSPHSLEFSANFSGDRFQTAGFGQTLATAAEPWAIFSTSGGGQLYARTHIGAASIDTPLGPALMGSFHRYRIDWTPAGVDYYVDSAMVISHAMTAGGPMRPIVASDLSPFGAAVLVDWMRLTPYQAGGAFRSRVFDASSPVTWRSMQWTARAPSGTSIAISVRTGSTPTPPDDGTVASDGWTAFAPVDASGPISATSQFIQYEAAMATGDPNQTPELDDMIISTSSAPIAANDAAATDMNVSDTFPASGPGSLTRNDTDLDTPASQLRVVAVSSPLHGTATLDVNGSVTYTPVPDFSGADRFTYTISDGLLTSTATVVMTVRDTSADHNPVAINRILTTREDTPVSAMLSASAVTPVVYRLIANGTKGTATIINAATGAFSYSPFANANGSDTFTFKVNDGTLDSNVATVAVTITPVNDAPSFTNGADQIVPMNSGVQIVPDWATSLSPGAPNEAAQSLSFIVSNNNTALFSVQPAIASNGTLTYTSAANAVGSATVTVAITDDGGTANNGADTSAAQTFTINVGKDTAIKSDFNGTPIAAGDFLWFNSVVKVSGLSSNPTTIGFTGSIAFTAKGTPYVVSVPSAIINFSPAVAVATTAFCDGRWVTTLPKSGGNVFLTGVPLEAPAGGFPGGIKDVTWRGVFYSLTPGLKIQWKWAAAVYHDPNFDTDYNALGVKPVDGDKLSAYRNSDHAGTPENFKRDLIAGADGGGGSNYTGGYSGTEASVPTNASVPVAACPGS
jgi:hypothetical protein